MKAATVARRDNGSNPYSRAKLAQMRWYGIVSMPAKSTISTRFPTAKSTHPPTRARRTRALGPAVVPGDHRSRAHRSRVFWSCVPTALRTASWVVITPPRVTADADSRVSLCRRYPRWPDVVGFPRVPPWSRRRYGARGGCRSRPSTSPDGVSGEILTGQHRPSNRQRALSTKRVPPYGPASSLNCVTWCRAIKEWAWKSRS